VVRRPDGVNSFEFCVLAGLRAAQLQRGCVPRVPACEKVVVTAQHEVAERKVMVGPVFETPTLATTVE
jgi:DNA-directed RNA polymerase subunit K/omega